jgi:hypothetical protein
MADKGIAKELPLDSLQIIESDSLKRLIREEIRAAKVSWWRQLANWQFVSGVMAASVIFGALLKLFIADQMIDRFHEFVGTVARAHQEAVSTFSSMERIVRPYEVSFGEDFGLEFSSEVCGDAVPKPKAECNVKIPVHIDTTNRCPVFCGPDDVTVIPVVGLSGQWVQVDAYVAQSVRTLSSIPGCLFEGVSSQNLCSRESPVRIPSINELQFLIADRPVEMKAVLAGFEFSTEGSGPWSFFTGKIQIPPNKATSALRLVEFRVTHSFNPKQNSNFAIFGNLHISGQEDFAEPPADDSGSTKKG